MGTSALVLVTGCLASDSTETSAVARSGTFTVHGTVTLNGVADDGIETKPIDVSAVSFSALTQQHGDFVTTPGQGNADGTFSVQLPAGTHEWDLFSHLFAFPLLTVTDARSITAAFHVLGRVDAAAALLATDVAISVTGLDPWGGPADSTQIVAGNAGTVVFSPELLPSMTPPVVGDTAISGHIDWKGNNLVDAAKGDVTLVSQLVTRSSGGATYSGLDRIGTVSGFTQSDGVASSLTAALGPVAQHARPLRWRASQFQALSSEVGAGASDNGALMFIDALPLAAELGWYTTSPDLMVYQPADTADHDMTVSYGNPYATHGVPWDEYFAMYGFYGVPVQFGDAASTDVGVNYQENLSLPEIHDGLIAPRISPVRDVRIEGRPLNTAQSGVGTSPTVRWRAPRIGRATIYTVAVEQLGSAAGKTTVTPVVTFRTKERSVAIPSAVLTTGATYILVISATDFGDVDQTEDLGGDGFPMATIGMVTAQFTP